MKVSIKTDAELNFIIADINSAISAMPDNPKVRQYLDERDACRKELSDREWKRIIRRGLKLTVDPLVSGVRKPMWHYPNGYDYPGYMKMTRVCCQNTDYNRQQYRNHCINYGLAKRFPNVGLTIS